VENTGESDRRKMTKKNRKIVTSFEGGYCPDVKSTDVFILDAKYRRGGDFPPPRLGEKVTVVVRRRPGRKSLVSAVVDTQVDDCTCGACDYAVRLVAVRKRALDTHRSNESQKLTIDRWLKMRG